MNTSRGTNCELGLNQTHGGTNRDKTFTTSKYDDVLAQNMVMALDKAIRKEQRTETGEKAKKYQIFYYKVYYVKYVTLYIYMFMVFFEVPSWCLTNSNIKDRRRCDPDVYPNSGIPKLPHYISRLIELICLFTLLFFTFFRRTFRKLTKLAKSRELIQTILTFASVIDIMVALIRSNSPYISHFIRILLIVIFIRGLREALKRIALVIADSKEILLMIISYIILFGWVGFRLFRGTQQGEAYFSSLSESIWSMMVLLTTANFPDVMMLAYNINRAYAIFFIIYLVFVLFFLLNLVLAVYYNNYRTRVDNTISKFMSIREQFLQLKFQSHDLENKGYLTQREFKSMITDLFELNLQAVKKTNLNKIAAQFSHRCRGQITLEDFLQYFEIMDFVSLDNQISGSVALKVNLRRRRVKKIVTNAFYDLLMNVIVALNIVSILAKDMGEMFSEKNEHLMPWLITQLIITWLFLAEMILICYGFGVLKAFKRRNHLKIEILFQIIILSAFIYYLVSLETEVLIRYQEIIIILRGFRLMKLFNEIKQWKIIIRTISSLIKPFASLLLVSFVFFLLFSLIGDRAFGGLSATNSNVVRDQNIPDTYIEMNFNDIANSFVTLFTLMVVNNWHVIVLMFENITGTIWTRLFFILFYFFSVLVILNILVALSIDIYSSIESINSQNEKKDREDPTNEDDLVSESFTSLSQVCNKYKTTPIKDSTPSDEEEDEFFFQQKEKEDKEEEKEERKEEIKETKQSKLKKSPKIQDSHECSESNCHEPLLK
ncbi:unnamed protein product [Moneuplotes crassus]|uniref:EF-hand domain-containing protein n=1 Tax=Euplotes crassus TaxID=5936 RepID=A0AAD2DA66_EUPCR|nr:unnamed protein product [Moneuplotes crassus]